MRYLLVIVMLLAGATAAAAYFVLQSPDRYKPALESLIEERTGVPLRIGGDVAWRFWPPVSLQAGNLSADHQGQTWQVTAMSLDLDLKAIISDPQQWRVQSLTIRDASIIDGARRLTIDEATVAELEPRRAAPFSARLGYHEADAEAVPVFLDGLVRIDPDTLEVSLERTRLETADAQGVCDGQIRILDDAPGAPHAAPGDLIPVAVLRGHEWHGRCLLDWVQVNGQRFESVTVELDNRGATSRNVVRSPRFFGGEAVFDLVIEAGSEPVLWHLKPTLTDVDSQALIDWLDQRLRWAAPLILSGELRFTGNDRDAALSTLSGHTRFDGGRGEIDIAEIRARLIELATRLNESDRIARWPETWRYQRFTGDWRVDQQQHALDVVLDNLSLTARGEYAPLADQMDVNVELVFGQDPAMPVFELNPALYDLPIPLRCRGTLAEPDCRLDGDAAARIVTQALADGENSAMRAALEQKIDEQVPEQYRGAARALLEMLGGGEREAAAEP